MLLVLLEKERRGKLLRRLVFLGNDELCRNTAYGFRTPSCHRQKTCPRYGFRKAVLPECRRESLCGLRRRASLAYYTTENPFCQPLRPHKERDASSHFFVISLSFFASGSNHLPHETRTYATSFESILPSRLRSYFAYADSAETLLIVPKYDTTAERS